MSRKEQLVRDREQARVTFLTLKQKYNSHEQKVYLIVEGKDDVAYYTALSLRYPKLGGREIIPAGNRKKVVQTYELIDWNCFSRNRILFFIDRDLSDITGEYTPVAQNVYVADDYSIENSIFNEQLLLTILRVYCKIDDLDDKEIKKLSDLYQKARAEHAQVFFPIMSWILCWRKNGEQCLLDNLKSRKLFQITEGVFELKDEYSRESALESAIHSFCGVKYISRDIIPFSDEIHRHGGIQKLIRGKYVLEFFVMFLNSIKSSIPALFPQRSPVSVSVSFADSNILQLVSGYSIIPESLDAFFSNEYT